MNSRAAGPRQVGWEEIACKGIGMAFKWKDGWNSPTNNDGSSKEQIIATLKNVKYATGDAGLLAALGEESDKVTVEKGIHPAPDHITLDYLGGVWHADVLGIASGGHRVSKVTQWKA